GLAVCTVAHCVQSHGGSGRHGGDGGFSRSRNAGQGFAPNPAERDKGKTAIGKSNFDRHGGMTRAIFKSAWSLQTAAMQPGKVGVQALACWCAAGDTLKRELQL